MINLLMLAAVSATQPLKCDSPMTHSDINMCAGQAARAADAAMVSKYNTAMVILRNMDSEIDRKYDKRPSYSAALLSSQQAWLRFRAAQGVVEGYSARGGSMELMFVNGCYEEVTKARTKQINELLKLYSGT